MVERLLILKNNDLNNQFDKDKRLTKTQSFKFVK